MVKYIIPAAHWQRKDDPVRRIATRGQPQLKADLKACLAKLPELLPENAASYAGKGDWWDLLHAMNWHHFGQVLRAPFGQIGRIREAAAHLGAQQINALHRHAGKPVRFRKGKVRKDAGDEFAYDMYDEDLQAELRAAQDELISQLSQGVRDTVEAVVLRGAQQGLSPDDIVDDIRSVITLTDKQAQAVLNYRDMLETLDSDALERRLRNSGEDDAVQAAIDSGEPLDQAMIDKLVGDYEDNYLDYRAGMIAQTESTRAANAGLQDVYQQAIDRGVFDDDAVRQHWRIDLGENVCPVCRSIPGRNPNGVAIGESFDSIDGPQDAPPVHPNCQCSVEVVTDLGTLTAGSGDEAAA